MRKDDGYIRRSGNAFEQRRKKGTGVRVVDWKKRAKEKKGTLNFERDSWEEKIEMKMETINGRKR